MMGKNLLFFLLLLCLPCLSKAQNFKGLWHGYITAKGQLNQSLYALNVKSQEGNIISGRAYLYNNFLFVFYGIFDFIGTVDKGNVKITELALGEYQIPFNNLCIKFANVNYSKKGEDEYLTGTWDNMKGSCPVADVLLKKHIPEEANSALPAEVLKKINEDTNKGIPFRETLLTKPFVLNISKPTIKIEIRDYLREDNDTVTVFVNRDEVIKRHRISHKPYKKTISFNKLAGLNEIIVYANNLGNIPPNTCVMIIDDGSTKQRVNIFSSKQSSAVIYLNYTPKVSRLIPVQWDIMQEKLGQIDNEQNKRSR
ncbi:hypothetical protein WG906_03835 [Pedobacter sp. P351]|uniref:hypothetical protein n=1 Tax=Pedobacter superstes TaxID=3133441 RepID=UPI0030A9D964